MADVGRKADEGVAFRHEIERMLAENSDDELLGAILNAVVRRVGEVGAEHNLTGVLRDAAAGATAFEAIHNIRSFVTAVGRSLQVAEDTLPMVISPGSAQGRSVAVAELCMAIDTARNACSWALDVGRGQLQIGRSQQSTTQLVSVLADAERMIQASRRSAAVLSVSHANEAIMMRAPHGRVLQVLLGLLRNADEVLATKSFGFVAVDCWATEDDVFVRVADNGPGISPQDRDRIFDVFYSTKEGGYGLGLSVSRRLVKEWGGNLRLEVSPLGGAAFVFNVGRARG